ncbi:MAG: TatD family hydrolase [Armatimonadetes bacterium]|nr:TatD family hydrolase [Akkermansiaceae bacterium]
MRLFDSHNHLQSGRFGRSVGQIIGEMKDAGIEGCVVNATRERDWEKVADMARNFSGFIFPAYGVHPWFADTVEEGWETRLKEILEQDARATLGEIGLDAWVDTPRMDLQRELFLKQIGIAVATGRVATIHCLKAWKELFEVMDMMVEWPEKFLMHSFGGSIEVAERLAKKGAYFSFSGHFLHERKWKVLAMFRKLPQDRILLETDAPEMMPPAGYVTFRLEEGVNHPGNLGRIAEKFAEEMGAGMLERVEENGRELWGI